MLKKTFQLFISNVGNVFLSFLTVVITARLLGLDARGKISLFAADLAWLQLLSGIVGSGSIYDLLKKFHAKAIITASFYWVLFCSSCALSILFFTGYYSVDDGFLLFICAVFSSLFQLLQTIIFIKKSHRIFYILRTLQPLIFFIGLLIFYYLNTLNVQVYFRFLAVTYVLLFILSLIFIQINFIVKIKNQEIKAVFKDAFKHGLINQSANFMQLINYRFGLFLLAKNVSLAAAGMFGMIGIFCEIIWLYSAGSSAYIAREVLKKQSVTTMFYRLKTTIKSTFLVSSIIFTASIFTPDFMYITLLGRDFIPIKSLLIYLFPGVIIFSLTKVLANYFAAKGRIIFNLKSSLLGVFFVVLLSIILVPKLGIKGALIAQNAALILVSIATGLFYYFSERKNEPSI